MKPIKYRDMQDELRHLRELALVDEASRLLRESNYADLNMDTLAEKVGISKKTLYQHFRTRDELIAQVLLKGFQALEAELATVADSAPLVQIEHIMRVYLRERYFPNSILASIGPEIIVRLKHSNDEVRQGMQHFQAIMSRIVDEAKRRGDIRLDLNSQIIVRSMFCLAGVLNEIPPQSTTDTTPYDLHQAIEDVIRLFLSGVVVHP
ncbi:MAG: TetR/AcrR family transcriptional regulator [Anaerolineae bacterium]|nr:TetR/AcrR family transcriptional regulator [Anaerolineae bacterium]